jgi:hypothetical protein
MHRAPYLLAFIVAFCGFMFTTPLGLGLNPDSIAYLKGGIGLVSGHGLSYVSAIWPPLYPILIALFGWLADDVILGARILNALFYTGTLVVLAEIIQRITKQHSFLSTILAGLVLIQTPLTYVHFYAWSEPCLLFWILTNLLLLSSLRESKAPSLIQIALIILASFSLFTRFAGIIVAATNCVMVFILVTDRSFLIRCTRAVAQLLIPILMFLPWTRHQGIGDGPAAARFIEFHPITGETISKGLMTIGRWLTPYSAAGYEQAFDLALVLSGSCLILIALAILIWSVLKYCRILRAGLATSTDNAFYAQENIILVSSALLTLTYVLFLVSALSFVDSKVVLDKRILVLIYPALLLCIIAIIYKIKMKTLRYAVIAALTLMMLTALPNLRGWLLLSRYGGIEMNSRSVIHSPIQRFAQSCSASLQVYADNPWNFDLYFSPKVFWLPGRVLYNSGRPNLAFQDEVNHALLRADLIIIEDKNSELISQIDATSHFARIWQTDSGIAWANKTKLTTDVCRVKE